MVRSVFRFVDAWIRLPINEVLEERFFLERDLNADQDSTVIRTVIAIVKQTDIPVWMH